MKPLAKNLMANRDEDNLESAESFKKIGSKINVIQNLSIGEELMFTLDVPYVHQQQEMAIIMAAADEVNKYAYDYVLKDCIETEHTPENPRSAMRGLPIAAMLSDYYAKHLGKTVNIAEIETSIIANTLKGKLTSEVAVSGRLGYGYDPNPGFIGNDQAIFMAEYKGKRYKIILDIKVRQIVNENNPVCPEPKLIKVKKPVAGLLDKVLGVSDIPFADFSGPTLAQTTGTGPTAQITLDTDADGYGWFIDDTPYLNVPTSNPNEWVARPGSAAEGKMDRLTVLLHEYGHALGLEHSADAHDFMAATLQPGVRRTLSVEEQMALMALAGVFATPDSPSAPYAPFAPMGLPLLFTRVSRSRNDTMAAALAAGQ